MTKKHWRITAFLLSFLLLLPFLSRSMLRLAYPQKYSELVEEYSSLYGVPSEIVYAVIKAESDFDPFAVSRAGAIGLMQLMPSTFLWLTEMTGESLAGSSLTDPEINIRYGTFLLRFLYDCYDDYDLVFAAYNAGMGNVSKWLSSNEYAENGRLVRIPFKETEKYVKTVNKYVKQYEKIYN